MNFKSTKILVISSIYLFCDLTTANTAFKEPSISENKQDLSIPYFTRYYQIRHNSKNTLDISDSYSYIEKQVWLSSEEMLKKIEPKVMEVLQSYPNHAYSNYLLSIFYMRRYKENISGLNSLRRASILARQAIEIDPTMSFGYIALANIATDIGQADKAYTLINQMTSNKKSNDWRKSLVICKILQFLGSNHQKISHLQYMQKQQKIDADLFNSFAYPILENLPVLKAMNTIQNLNLPKANLNYFLGRTQVRAKKHKIALNHYLQALDEGLDYLDLYMEAGALMVEHTNKFEAALNIFDLAISRAKLELKYSGAVLTDIHLNKGFAHLALNQRKEALESHVKSIKSFTHKDRLLHHIVDKYRSYGKPRELSSLLQAITDDVPGNSLAHALLGEVFTDDMNLPQMALNSFENAITLNPENAYYYSSLGLAYYKLKLYQPAIKIFTIALKINPENAVTKYNIACVLSILGETEKALASLKSAVHLDPSLIVSAQKDLDFKNLRHEPGFKNLIGKQGPTTLAH